MLALRKVSKQFGPQVLFQDVDLQVSLNDRIGLIGPNGSGKTTIFSLILDEQMPDSGQIERNKNMVIGCLKQEVVEDTSRPLLEEATDICPHLNRIRERIDLWQEEMAHEDDPEKIQDYVQKIGEYQAEFEARGGWDLEHQAKRILFGLGFRDQDLNRPIREFSGGWRMRISLAKLLLQEPDLLLLDEPTNHLDLESIIWLEDFLKGYQGAMILISHDRRFLNNIVTRIVEIDQKTLQQYTGNYDDFLDQKQLRQEILEASYRNQQKKIEATERFIERFRYKATKARQVQSRIKSLEKMDRIELDQKASQFSITIPPPPVSGKEVMRLKNVHKRYGDRTVYHGLNLVLHRGDRVALVGPNGSGKSTLLKIMAGVLDIEGGEAVVGYNVARAYFAQHQLEILDPEHTVLEEIDPCFGPGSPVSARSFLGAFLFRGDDVFKKIAVLSGGEKSRLVLAKMIAQKPNFLLLDEPTNHLDIPSLDCLQEALSQYPGTLCMISHDRLFINHLVNKIIHIQDGRLEVFLGNYDDYLEQMEQRKEKLAASPLLSPSAEPGSSRDGKVRSREQKRLEAEKRNQKFRRLDPLRKESGKVQEELNLVLEKMDQLDRLFADPNYYQQPEFSRKLYEYKELEARNEELTHRWTELEEQIEAVERELAEEG
ncbi:MAG: ATP-binding cassette domain-containing protein [bacterium]